MRFESISLTDFGIFRHANLAVDDGLTVIAGPQRAGKTTFRDAARKLPYGISRGDSVPPAVDVHELSATVVHDGHRYDLSVEGYADPVVHCLDDGPALECTDLTGDVLKRQYEQLFAVGQEQLRRIPEGVDDETDLSNIILGAAYGDIAAVPALRDEFSDAASDIAGKHGRKSYQLNDPLDTIEEGLAERRDANEMVDEYRETRRELESVEAGLAELSEEALDLRTEKKRLDLLEAKFDDLEGLRRVRGELESLAEPEYAFTDDAADTAREHIDEIEALAEAIADRKEELEGFYLDADVDVAAMAETLVEHEETLDLYERQLEVWKKTESDLETRDAELDRRRETIEREARELYADWEGDLERVLQVPTDAVSADRLRSVTEQYQEARDRLDSNRTKLQQERSRLSHLEESLEEAEAEMDDAIDEGTGTWGRSIAIGGGIAGVGLLVGAIVGSLFTPPVGFAVAGLALLVGLGYVYARLDTPQAAVDTAPVREYRTQVNDARATVESLEDAIEEADRDREAARDEFEARLGELGFPADLTPEGTMDFYRETRSLQADIVELQAERDAYHEELEALESELEDVRETLSVILDIAWTEACVLDETTRIYRNVEVAIETLAVAEEYTKRVGNLQERKADAAALLQDWETDFSKDSSTEVIVKELERYVLAAEQAARYESCREELVRLEQSVTSRFTASAMIQDFEPIVEADVDDMHRDEWALKAMETLAAEFGTRAEIDDQLTRIEERLTEINDEQSKLQETQAELNRELDELASDEDVRAAEAKIQRGRQLFERRYEEYATYRIGEQLLEMVHDRFVEEATGPLLAEASDIFERITREYAGVDQVGSLDSLEFEAIRTGDSDQSTDELSRATVEQLFLSIRLAKVRSFETTLPLVIDDALTSFDPAHASRTIAALDELAETNQVIYLTCHPEKVEYIDEFADVGAFWTLDEGHFDGSVSNVTDCVSVLDH